MDEDTIKSAGVEPLMKVLRKVDELFPAKKPHADVQDGQTTANLVHKQATLQAENQLSDVVLYLREIGVPALIEFVVGVGSFEALFCISWSLGLSW